MLDIHLFRDEPDRIRADFDRRSLPHDQIDSVITLDGKWKDLLHKTSDLRRQKNEAARGIGAAKKSGDEAEAQRILAEVADLGSQISEMEAQTTAVLEERDALRMRTVSYTHLTLPTKA